MSEHIYVYSIKAETDSVELLKSQCQTLKLYFWRMSTKSPLRYGTPKKKTFPANWNPYSSPLEKKTNYLVKNLVCQYTKENHNYTNIK